MPRAKLTNSFKGAQSRGRHSAWRQEQDGAALRICTATVRALNVMPLLLG